MKTRLLLLLPLALLLWGCPTAKDKDPEPAQGCQVQETAHQYKLGQEVGPIQLVRYHYNKQRQLTAMTVEAEGKTLHTFMFSYDAKSRKVQVNLPHGTYLNEYNAQDQLVKQRWSRRNQDGVLQELSYYTFSYNNQNELQEAHFFFSGNREPALMHIWRYTYTNGDPTTIERLSHAGEHELTVSLTYDDKQKHPQDRVAHYFEPLHAPSAHNLLQYVYTDYDGRETRYSNTFTYTKQGLPATKIITDGSSPEEKIRYTYSCQ